MDVYRVLKEREERSTETIHCSRSIVEMSINFKALLVSKLLFQQSFQYLFFIEVGL